MTTDPNEAAPVLEADAAARHDLDTGPILKLHGVGKRFPGVVALRNVTFDIMRGEGHVLLGENGAGKSTLINLLGGLFSPDEGSIWFNGAPYSPASPLEART